ncbi:Zn-ribbon domain-containing OB-fold protein [Hydrogenophaga sp.]|uniref:Zn-ribbon domain-containing OB-fold protein n=1 Tax=Hydrogenophaga sp. TaxID=1904254 RepID=UPI00271F9F0C|nr:OB-fold domain-containing protein [Hydrogenophaga sp.]MDO9435972.1 OB-fold domain-containing protein [Hydrogenophaga sp.]
MTETDDPIICPEQTYFAHLAEGRFMIQRSRSSGEYVFYPRVAAPRSGLTDLEWVAASGHGTVYARTTVFPKPPQEPYNVVLVDLAEGPRIMSRVDGIDPQQVRIGMAVQARILPGEEKPLLVFLPASPSDAL